VVSVIGAFVPIDALAEMVSIGTLFAFFVVAIAVIVLRRTKPKMDRPFRTPSVPWLPVASVVTCILLMVSLATETWLRFVAWFVVGMGVYFFYGRKHSRLAPGVDVDELDEEIGGSESA
jgi:APA family basic amino acid/polyamine antiporter